MASDRHQLRVLSRALKGDAEAFASLCFRYSEALYRYLYFRLGSVFAAEEMCAQVFVRAWELLPADPRQSVMPFPGWLFQVANDVVVERNRRFSQLGLHPTRPPLMAWSGASRKKERPQLHPRFLAQAVMQLDDVAQQVILLRFVIRMSHRETALVIGDTGAGSRVLQYRALLELREKLTRKKMSENAYASDYVGTATFCLDRIVSGRWDPADCLEHLPQDSDRLEQILDFAVLVRDASAIRPRRSFNADLRKQLLADIRQSKRRPVRQPWVWRWFLTASERVPAPLVAAFLLGVFLFISVAGGTGVAIAVDHAAPGSRLYDLDLRLESAYRAFLTSPENRLQFALDLTDERLDEAEMLAMRGDSTGLQVALVAYSVEVAALANDGLAEQDSPDTIDLDRHFSQQQQRLDKILVTALRASSMDSGGEAPVDVCGAEQDSSTGQVRWHPVGLTLAAQHDVAYREVMRWVCDGHSFGEIVLALASVGSTDVPTAEVLLLKSQLGGWGQLWQEMHATGTAQPAGGKTDQGDLTTPAATPESTPEPDTEATVTPTETRVTASPTPTVTATPKATANAEGDDEIQEAATGVPGLPDDVGGANDPGPPDWVDPPGGGPPDDPGPPDWIDPPGGGPPDGNPGNGGNSGGEGNRGNGNGARP